MLPRVIVNVNEVPVVNNVPITFTPAIIMRTMSGPEKTAEIVTTYDEFVSKFGVPTADTPVAYGLGEYLRQYQRVYVTRVADSTAIEGSGMCSFIPSGDSGVSTDIFGIKTVYKTEQLNGVEIRLVYKTDTKVLYFETTIDGETYRTRNVPNIDMSTLNAVELSEHLDVLVERFNELDLKISLENLFINKTIEDAIPEFTPSKIGSVITYISAVIDGGISGNTEPIDNEVIQAQIDLYNTVQIDINAMVFPEFENLDTINYAVNIGDQRRFFILVAPSAEDGDVSKIENTISNYPQSQHLVCYLDKVYLTNSDIAVPSNVAALFAFGATYLNGPYLAPAGINRASLPAVTRLRHNWTYDDLALLYNSEIPVNPIEFKSTRGYVLWGQKTTAVDNVYSSRIDGAALIDYVVKQLDIISQPYLFEQITEATFARWTLDARAVLEPLAYAQVITSNFKVIMDATNNTAETVANNQLIGAVTVQKTGVAEEVIINFSVTRQA